MNYRSSYSQKLLDPRWQRKRLEVMNAADFACEICGDSEATLNVHHKQYLKNHEPWDYDIKQLACICENCHSNLHNSSDLLTSICSYLPLDGKNNRDEIACLIAGIAGFSIPEGMGKYPEMINKIGHCIGVHGAKVVFERIKDI